MSGVRWARVARAFRRVALPLASYYAVTLALPLANGAAPSGAFMEHALVVLIVPPIAIILGCAVHTIAHALARLWNTASRHRREHGPRRPLFPRRAGRNLREPSAGETAVAIVHYPHVRPEESLSRASGSTNLQWFAWMSW
jgi:hypothetical protein